MSSELEKQKLKNSFRSKWSRNVIKKALQLTDDTVQVAFSSTDSGSVDLTQCTWPSRRTFIPLKCFKFLKSFPYICLTTQSDLGQSMGLFLGWARPPPLGRTVFSLRIPQEAWPYACKERRTTAAGHPPCENVSLVIFQ